jgi:predicted nucleic acid-binding protein
MAVLIDTGVLLRLWDRSDPNHAAILACLRLLFRQDIEIVTTAQNVAEFWNVSTRPLSARAGYGQSLQLTDRRVQFFERFGRILFDTPQTYSEWRRLVRLHQVSGVAVHDARIVAQMLVWGISRVLTLNSKDFRRYTEISAVSPAELLAMIQDAG